MKALLCTEFGPPEQLRICDVPVPVPGPGKVLVRVESSALNFPEALTVQGLYQIKPALPWVPGHEIAGTVVAAGPDVGDVRTGDRVAAAVEAGGHAEYCLADVRRLIRLPDGAEFDAAAALLVAYGTALHALQRCGRLQAGETLLVLGAAGGVGSAAVELGKLLGARVIAAASSAERLVLCRGLGADDVIDYGRDDLRDAALALTDQRGVDVVFDPVGGPLTERALRATAWRGRLLVIGFAGGEIAKLPANLALLKERSVIGVNRGAAFQNDPQEYRRDVEQLGQWLAEGRLRPAVTERITLDQVPGALRRMLDRQLTGKVVCKPQWPASHQ
jgi:NADPH2:quinone reductase